MNDHKEGTHGGGSVALYIGIALVLGAITYLEFALVEYEFAFLSDGGTLLWLALLSVGKFILVVMFFMHLFYDSRVFTAFFASGMFLAVGTILGLSLLFNVKSLAKQELAAPLEEPTEIVAEAQAEEGEHGQALPERSLAARLATPEPKDQALDLGPRADIEEWHTPLGRGDEQVDEERAPIPLDEPGGSVWEVEPRSGPEAEGGPDTGIEERVEAGQIDPAAVQAGEQEAEAEAQDPAGEVEEAEEAAGAEAPAFDWQQLGQTTYANCAGCHGANGQGVPGAFPPLAGHLPRVARAEGGRAYLIDVLLYGLQGQITVNGQGYNGVMPPWPQLSDEQIAAVLNHELTSWGNAEDLADFPPILPQDVAAQRDAGLSAQDVHQERQELGLE